jgi:magnesium chelatase family protein
MIRRYRGRVSGPLLDRIDLHVEVPRLPPAELRLSSSSEDSATVRNRVIQARAHQHARAGKPNALLGQSEMTSTCRLCDSDQTLLERAIDALQLSARSMHRILRVARTIADLADSPDIQTTHLTEAIGYRRVDRDLDSQATCP